MTVIGGVGHTYFLISEFQSAVIAAVLVVVIELGVISWVRHRDMDLKRSAALQTGLSGVPNGHVDWQREGGGVKSSSSISTQTSAGAR